MISSPPLYVIIKSLINTSLRQVTTWFCDISHDIKSQGSTLRVNLWPQASKNSPKQRRASKKDLNWSYRPSKNLETFLLKSFPPRMSPNVFEINEDKIYKYKCCGEFYAVFFLVMLKKKCRTSKIFAGPADARCYWSYRAIIILS